MGTSRRRPVTESTLRRVLALSALVSLLAVGLVAFGLWHAARSDASRDARRVSDQIASTVVPALASHDYRQTDDTTRARLRERLAPFLDSGVVYRVKVWSVRDDGLQIVFSDEPRVIGERKPPDPELVGPLLAGETVVVPVPDDAEHRFEIAEGGGLLEVFTGFTDAAGAFTLLEIYVPVGVVQATYSSLLAVLPLATAGLLCLTVGLVPVAVALARRLDRTHSEQQEVLHYGLAAAELRSREIASTLHDELLPDLASVGLLIDTARRGADGEVLERARAILTKDITEIRTVLSSVAATLPPADDPEQLFTELAMRLCGADQQVHVDVDSRCADTLGADAVVMLHRVAGELLRNVVRHSRAQQVHLHLAVEPGPGGVATLTVTDDGVGFDPLVPSDTGHIGLQLIRRVLDDVGGELAVSARPGEGSSVTVRVPTELRLPGRAARAIPNGGRRDAEVAHQPVVR